MAEKEVPIGHTPSVELRAQAESLMHSSQTDVSALAGEEVQRMVDELQVHQIELELQGEELREAQVELAAVRDRYIDLYEFSPIGYLTLLPNGEVLEANLCAASMLAVERRSLIGRSLFSFVAGESLNDFTLLLRNILESMSGARCETRMKRYDGTVFEARMDIMLRLGEVGVGGTPKINEVRIGLFDITDHKLAKAALEEMDRKKDEFIGMLAHELRNPMASISAAVRLLSRPGTELAQQQMARESLTQRMDQLRRLVDDLLDISSLVRGRVELKKERLQLDTVISRAVEAVRWMFELQEQRLVVQVVDSLPIFGDPLRLEQIINNLLTNASRYSDPGRQTELTAYCDGAEAVVKVRDDGIGIPKNILPDVFQAFHQAETSIARTRGGLGLGLSIAKMLSEMHGGTISVESEGEGAGSTFTVRLPIFVESGEQIGAEKQPTISLKPLRILLVEDQEDTAVMEAALLEEDGHTVEIAMDGPSGVQKALAMKPDVILLDIGLPGCSGYDVAQKVRSELPEKPVIVAVTGYGRECDIAKSSLAGIDYHLTKPIEHTLLIAALGERFPKSG